MDISQTLTYSFENIYFCYICTVMDQTSLHIYTVVHISAVWLESSLHCSRYRHPSGHTTLKWRRINVDATWSRRIDVDTMSFWYYVPAGMPYTELCHHELVTNLPPSVLGPSEEDPGLPPADVDGLTLPMVDGLLPAVRGLNPVFGLSAVPGL